jgi:hypothetical protein
MNINQILNSALLNESGQNADLDSDMDTAKQRAYKKDVAALKQAAKSNTQKPENAQDWDITGDPRDTKSKVSDWLSNPKNNMAKYGGAAAIGLGAGIGALALAKKLRAKKAAAKAGKTKKA